MQPEPAAHDHCARREIERAAREGARRRLELPERSVGMEKVRGADGVGDDAVGAAGVHGERAADRRRNAGQPLDAAEIQRRRFADQRRQAGAGAGHGLLALELDASQTAVEPQHDAAQPAIRDEQVVAAADDDDGKLLAVREAQGVPDVVEILRDDEDVGGAAKAQRRVKRQELLESHLSPDFTQHVSLPCDRPRRAGAPDPVPAGPRPRRRASVRDRRSARCRADARRSPRGCRRRT